MSTTLHTEIVNDLLKLAVESGASDIVIKSEKPGYLRIGGRLRTVGITLVVGIEDVVALVAVRFFEGSFRHGFLSPSEVTRKPKRVAPPPNLSFSRTHVR